MWYYSVVVKHEKGFDIDFVEIPKRLSNKANERAEILQNYYNKLNMEVVWECYFASNYLTLILKKIGAEEIYDSLQMVLFVKNHDNKILDYYKSEIYIVLLLFLLIKT